MLFHTHIAFGIFLALVFYPFLGSIWLVAPVMIIASVLADIDTPTSKVGSKWILRPMQWCVRHRGFFHSFLAAIFISLAIAGWNLNLGIGAFIL